MAISEWQMRTPAAGRGRLLPEPREAAGGGPPMRRARSVACMTQLQAKHAGFGDSSGDDEPDAGDSDADDVGGGAAPRSAPRARAKSMSLAAVPEASSSAEASPAGKRPARPQAAPGAPAAGAPRAAAAAASGGGRQPRRVSFEDAAAPRRRQFGMLGPVAAPSLDDLVGEEGALASGAPPAAAPALPPPPAGLPMPNLSRLSPFAAGYAGPPAAVLPASTLALAASKLVGGLGLAAPNPAAEGLARGGGFGSSPRLDVWPGSPAGADAAAVAFAPSDRVAQGRGFGRREDLAGAADAAVAEGAAPSGRGGDGARAVGSGGGGLAEDARSWSVGLLALPGSAEPPGARLRPGASARGAAGEAGSERDAGFVRHRLSTHPAHSSAAASAATIAAVAAASSAAGGRTGGVAQAGAAPASGRGARPARRVRIASAPVLVQDE